MIIVNLIIILFNLILLSLTFFSIFIICEHHLVEVVEVFIRKFRVPEGLAAVTLVAFGSAAPELLLNIVSVIQVPPSSDISISAVLGSAIIAFGLIPSVVVLSSSIDVIEFKPLPICRETSFYLFGLIMFLSAIVDGFVDTIEAVYLVAIYVLYVSSVYISYYINGNSESNDTNESNDPESNLLEDQQFVEDVEQIVSDEISILRRIEVTFNHYVAETMSGFWSFVIPSLSGDVSKFKAFQVLLACIFYVGCHSFVLIYLSKVLISFLHVESSTLGATLISMGSEIPDLIGSVALMRRGFYDGAIASAIGSQVINITLGIGFPSIILCLRTRGGIFSISIKDLESYEMLISILFVIIMLYASPLLVWMCNRKNERLKISKTQGMCLLGFYCIMSTLFVYFN